jgi:hypothetical protein
MEHLLPCHNKWKKRKLLSFPHKTILQHIRMKVKMTADEYKQRIVKDFRIGKCETMDISVKTYRLCFPTPESLCEFIKTSGLHIHINPKGRGGRIKISIYDEIPWG